MIGEPGQTWTSQRDHLLLQMLYNTGARVSEIIGVTRGRRGARRRGLRASARQGTQAAHGAAVALDGHGRSAPGCGSTRSLQPTSALLPNRDGQAMTRGNVTQRLALGSQGCQRRRSRSLAERTISPHTIRHTTAMHLLQSGVDISVIALWLGHESPTTTHQYVEADLAMKERRWPDCRSPMPPSAATRHPTH